MLALAAVLTLTAQASLVLAQGLAPPLRLTTALVAAHPDRCLRSQPCSVRPRPASRTRAVSPEVQRERAHHRRGAR